MELLSVPQATITQKCAACDPKITGYGILQESHFIEHYLALHQVQADDVPTCVKPQENINFPSPKNTS